MKDFLNTLLWTIGILSFIPVIIMSAGYFDDKLQKHKMECIDRWGTPIKWECIYICNK